ETVVVIVPPLRFRVDAEKIHQVILVGGTQKEVGVRASRGNDERTLLLPKRALQHNAAGHGPGASCAVQLALVLILRPHLAYRREAAAESGGDSTLVEFRILDDVGVEYGEQAEEV